MSLEHSHQLVNTHLKYKKCSSLHILPQNPSTSVHVKMSKYTRCLAKWTVTVNIYTVTVHHANHFFILFSLSSIKLLLFPNHYNNPARQNQLKINQTHLLKINQNQPSFNWKLTQNQQKINPNTSTQTNLHRDTLAKKKKNTERLELMGTISAWLEWSKLVGLAWSELNGMGLSWSMLVDRSCGDRCLPDRSYGSVLVTEMVWIGPRGRVDS